MTTSLPIKIKRGRTLDPLLMLHDVQQAPPDVARVNDEWSRAKEARNILKTIVTKGGTTRDALEYIKDHFDLTTDAAVYNLWKSYVRQARRELGVSS